MNRRFFNIVIVLVMVCIMLMPSAKTSAQTNQDEVLALTEKVVELTIQGNDIFWVQKFKDWGFQEPYVGWDGLYPTEKILSNCVDRITKERSIYTGTSNNAWYCGADAQIVNEIRYDGVIYVPLLPLAEMVGGDMWDRGTIPAGNYAAVAIVSHEFAHHITHELSSQRNIAHPANPHSELVADCLAGRFMQTFELVGELSEDQINGILFAYGYIGDENATTDSHGTYEERQYAFLLGYNGGQNAELDCLKTYYPAIMR